MRVLMLGWEREQAVAWGLGVACEGLARGLENAGVDVRFVTPNAENATSEHHVAPLGPYGTMAGRTLAPTRSATAAEAQARAWRAPVDQIAADALRSRIALRATGPDANVAPWSELECFTDEVLGIMRQEPFDVIHAHDWMTWPAGLRGRAATHKPLVCHVHTCEHDRRPDGPDAETCALEQAGLDGADRVVCVSQYEAGRVAKHYGVEARRLRVVRNAVDGITSAPGFATRAQDTPRGSPLVLFAGRLTPQKDPCTLLAAAARVHRQRPDARFVFAGDGELRIALQARARLLGLAGDRPGSSCVEFPGFVQPAVLAQLLASATLFVLPSRSEPFGLAALEALAAGVPTIVSRNCGVVEVAPSVVQVDSGDVNALSSAILELLEDPERAARLGNLGRTEAGSWSWECSARRMIEVYEEVLR